MSYNIDTWKTKKLNDLFIPIEAFYRHSRNDWHPKRPQIIDAETNEAVMECGCEQSIKGHLSQDGQIQVTELQMAGEGSGTFYHWILEPALQESTGELEAVLIWEGGDLITRLTVKDGQVRLDNVEL